MSVLVTGVAGFIGSHVAATLCGAGHEVVGLDDLSGGFTDNIPAGVCFYQGSILDQPLLAEVFTKHKIKYIFHLAAYAAEGLSHFIRNFNYTNNLVGSVNLINQAVKHKVQCFVFTSSIAVYGSGKTPLREDHTPNPEDPYGIAKYAVELDLKAAHYMFGLNYIIFRPHNVYGEHQNISDRYRNVIGIFMNQIMNDQPMTLFGDGSQTRCFSYVGDVAPCIANAINLPEAQNEVFNIGSSCTTPVKDLASMVADAMGAKCNIHYCEARKEVLHAVANHSKIERILGYRAKYDLRDGLNRMAVWAKTIGPRKPTVFSHIEVCSNLPKIWS